MIVDISKHQGKIDWDTLAPLCDFVIIKATGDLYNGVDPHFHANARACIERNKPLHVYHFIRAHSVDAAREEARFFVETARQYDPLSYVLDLEGETLADPHAVEIAQAFMAELRSLGVGRVGLYTGHSAYKERGLDAIDRDWLWIARYGDKNDGNLPDEQHRPVPCDLWQYTDQGVAPGINGHVDLNIIWSEKPMSYFTGRDKNMAVIIGSARGDENGNAHGGQPGDQTGKEVSTQSWYKHSKGWLVFRAKDPDVTERIAYDMQAACDNPHIGYDQYDRLTLYDIAKPVGFDCAKVTTDCETDCSALVRVCCAYAGIDLINFNTAGEPNVLRNSGAFIELTGAKYSDSSDYLRRGDILCTASQGHTAVVLTDGSKAFDTGLPTLKRGDKDARWGGDKGDSVETMQKLLLAHGFSIGSDGADGDFGKNTEVGLISFQKANGLTPDGVCGPTTWAALQTPEKMYTVTIRGIDKSGVEELKKKWPQCEIAEEAAK